MPGIFLAPDTALNAVSNAPASASHQSMSAATFISVLYIELSFSAVEQYFTNKH
jgi:hypothetical protein